MGRQPRAEIMTPLEMDRMNQEYSNSRLYDKSSTSSQKVSEAVNAITEQIMTAPHGRIQLSDTEMVKATAFQYITSCQRAGIIPSKIGLSRALGVTRRSLDTYVVRNPESDTGVFLSMLFDSFAEMLSMSTMTGATREIFGIFLLKDTQVGGDCSHGSYLSTFCRASPAECLQSGPRESAMAAASGGKKTQWQQKAPQSPGKVSRNLNPMML